MAKALLRDLLERGLDPERARVIIIEGPKALHAVVHKVWRSAISKALVSEPDTMPTR